MELVFIITPVGGDCILSSLDGVLPHSLIQLTNFKRSGTEKHDRGRGKQVLAARGKGSGLQAIKLSRHALCKEKFILDSNICIKVILGGQVSFVLTQML